MICCGFGLEVAAAMGWGRKMVRRPTCAEFLLPVMMRINLAAAAPLNELGNAMNFFLLLVVIFVIHLEAGLPLMSTQHALHTYQSAAQ